MGPAFFVFWDLSRDG
uniref:Uncharacterized protein n=1 Tax=Arundo donax TaxID=35708 RepID=A0A0A9B8L0_ARUDO